MAKLDLMAPLRKLSSGDVSVSCDAFEVDTDPQPIAHTVGDAMALHLVDCLLAGTDANGQPLQSVTQSAQRARKSHERIETGTRGNVTGTLARSFRAQLDSSGNVTIAPHTDPRREHIAGYVLDGVELVNMDAPKVEAAIGAALDKAMGE